MVLKHPGAAQATSTIDFQGLRWPQKREGLSPPTPLDGFEAPRGRPGPEHDRFSAKSKTTLCEPPSGATGCPPAPPGSRASPVARMASGPNRATGGAVRATREPPEPGEAGRPR